VKSSGAEVLRAAVVRSRWIILVAMLVGIVAVSVFSYLRGPAYTASAQVLVSDKDLGAALTGSQPAFTDARLLLQTESELARSTQLYDRVAESTDGRLGTGDEIRQATTISSSGSDYVLGFTARRDTAALAEATANAVAGEFPAWRSEIAVRPINASIDQARERLAQEPDNADLREKLATLTILRTLSSDTATLVDSARDAAKVQPSPVRDGILGLVLGLVVGLVVSAGREALDTRVRSEADVEDILSAPVLGTVGPAPKGVRLLLFGRHRQRFEDEFALLAADIDHRQRERGAASLAVTGASRDQGKTTVAVNLAVALARRGARVVLVDFDLRRPKIADTFGIPGQATGVISVVTSDADPMAALWYCSLEGSTPEVSASAAAANLAGYETAATSTYPDGRSGSLRILPSGGAIAVDDAIRMLRPARIVRLVDALKEHCDWIIFDTPPALGAIEMTMLAEVVDGSLVVVRQGQVSRRALRVLERQSQKWRTQPVGAVITEVRREPGQGYYGSE
jgi:polysaccharide biosynthesis transport protein